MDGRMDGCVVPGHIQDTKIPWYYHLIPSMDHGISTILFCKGDWTKEFLFCLPWGSWGWSWSIPCGWCFSRAAPGLEGLVPAGSQKGTLSLYRNPPPKPTACYWPKATHMAFFMLHLWDPGCDHIFTVIFRFYVCGGCNTRCAVISLCWRDSSYAIYLNHCDYTEYISDSDLGHWFRSMLQLLNNIDWLNVNCNVTVHFIMNYKLNAVFVITGKLLARFIKVNCVKQHEFNHIAMTSANHWAPVTVNYVNSVNYI